MNTLLKTFLRKVMYALGVEVVVDNQMRFRYMPCRCTGRTHDVPAFDLSEIAVRLKDRELKDAHRIAGDATYVSTPGSLTSWSKEALSGEDGIYADSFKFYRSSNR